MNKINHSFSEYFDVGDQNKTRLGPAPPSQSIQTRLSGGVGVPPKNRPYIL